MQSAFIGLVFALSAQCGQTAVVVDEPELDKKQLKLWEGFYRQEAEEYEIFVGAEGATKLEFRSEPVFRWASPQTSNEFNGVIFIWTHDGRPEVLGSIWSAHSMAVNRPRRIAHTFHSLSLQPLRADRKGKPFWYPPNAGLDLKPIHGARPPVESRRLRLAEMRSLAREFTAMEEVQAGRSVELRLLAQPIFRYESGPHDGAIFAFLNDWDPEVLLMIETRGTAEGLRWHYAPIRFCYLSVHVMHGGEEVWAYKRGGPMRDPRHYYFSVHDASLADRYLKDLPDN